MSVERRAGGVGSAHGLRVLDGNQSTPDMFYITPVLDA
jgi:hypothetical protein